MWNLVLVCIGNSVLTQLGLLESRVWPSSRALELEVALACLTRVSMHPKICCQVLTLNWPSLQLKPTTWKLGQLIWIWWLISWLCLEFSGILISFSNFSACYFLFSLTAGESWFDKDFGGSIGLISESHKLASIVRVSSSNRSLWLLFTSHLSSHHSDPIDTILLIVSDLQYGLLHLPSTGASKMMISAASKLRRGRERHAQRFWSLVAFLRWNSASWSLLLLAPHANSVFSIINVGATTFDQKEHHRKAHIILSRYVSRSSQKDVRALWAQLFPFWRLIVFFISGWEVFDFL